MVLAEAIQAEPHKVRRHQPAWELVVSGSPFAYKGQRPPILLPQPHLLLLLGRDDDDRAHLNGANLPSVHHESTGR